MTKTVKQKQQRRPEKSRPPFASRPKPKSWRARHFYVWLNSRRRLELSFRRFQTKGSKPYGIIHLPWRVMGVKEVALKHKQFTRKKAPVGFFSRYALPMLIIIAGIGGTAYFARSVYTTPTLEPVNTSYNVPLPDPEPEVVKTPSYLPSSKPIKLTLPSIDTEADIITVGLQADNTIGTPPVFDYVAGWYDGSPTPGEKGPAIIVGHVDTISGPSVFWRLRELVPGDQVEVLRQDGQTVAFQVTDVKQFSQSDFPTEEVYGNIDHAGLRLITCGGTFNQSTQRYSHNTVVYARVFGAL